MMMANATAAPVASNVRAANPARASARGITNNARRATKTNAGVRSAQFFQGDVDASMELRQRNIASAVSHRASAKRVVTASATPAPIVQAGDAAVAPKAEWKGAKLKPLGYSVLAGLIIWCIPAPVGVTVKAWHLFAVFVGTIVGIITNVRPPRDRSIEFTRGTPHKFTNSFRNQQRTGDRTDASLLYPFRRSLFHSALPLWLASP